VVLYPSSPELYPMNPERIGSDGLHRLMEHLTELDHAVLSRLAQHRYLQTEQITRFELRDRPTHLAGLRAAHRTLKKLRVHGLVAMMERTIGGATRGSTAAVWTLTNTGIRTVAQRAGEIDQSRRRLAEPTLIFLRHELAVAELHLALTEAASSQPAALRDLQLEPTCWRRYLGPLGAMTTLKPDMAIEVETTNFDSRYFFEVDRATEPPHRIVAKCLQYQEYYRSGEEERRSGVLPLIVWVVPNEVRREQLFRHLTTGSGINPRLYRVLLMGDIPALIGEDDEVGTLPENMTEPGGQS
jgi:hypothetical protein